MLHLYRIIVFTHSNEIAFEHILLGVLLEQPPINPTYTTTPPFQAYFTEAEVACASDFITITPSAYG